MFPTGHSGMYKIEVAKFRSGEMQVVSGAKNFVRYCLAGYTRPDGQRNPAERGARRTKYELRVDCGLKMYLNGTLQIRKH